MHKLAVKDLRLSQLRMLKLSHGVDKPPPPTALNSSENGAALGQTAQVRARPAMQTCALAEGLGASVGRDERDGGRRDGTGRRAISHAPAGARQGRRTCRLQHRGARGNSNARTSRR